LSDTKLDKKYKKSELKSQKIGFLLVPQPRGELH
jgi:hypothetical protein